MLQYWLGVHHRALCGVHVHRAPGCTGFEHPFTTLGAWRPHSPFPIGGCIFKQPLGFGRLPPLDPKQGRTVPRTAARPARSTTLTRCHADAYCNVDTHYRALYLIVILPIDKPGVSLRGRGGIVLLHGVGEEGSSLKKKKKHLPSPFFQWRKAWHCPKFLRGKRTFWGCRRGVDSALWLAEKLVCLVSKSQP